VEAGDEDIGCSGKIIHQFRPNGYDLTKSGAERKVVIYFTVCFTTKASDAVLHVLV
jgi:hypothetical protein